MAQKVAVITGSHIGLGYAIARKLAQKEDIQVVLTSRNDQDGIAAQQRLSDENIQTDYPGCDGLSSWLDARWLQGAVYSR